MYQIVNETPPKPSSLNPDIPEMLDDIVCKCLEKNPVDRYKSAKQLADDLRLCRETLLHSKDRQNSHFLKSNQFKRLAIPGGVPQNQVLTGSFVAMVIIFIFDIITDDTIQMHLLYIFPLIMIGFHCERKLLVNTGVALALALQAITLLSYSDTIPVFSKLVLTSLILPTNILVVYMSRIARENFLEVGRLTTFDGLTGLHNRLTFESITETEITRQKNKGGVFSFAVIDIDNFKNLNDSRGYLAGDETLRLLANILRQHIRSSDTVARIGGDEFAILMPNSDTADCESFCNHLAVKVADGMAAASLPVNTSIGHVTFEQAPASIAEVFDMTEKALHAAQQKVKG
jgi:diguanylate cyclase (GGDEF)-like protein